MFPTTLLLLPLLLIYIQPRIFSKRVSTFLTLRPNLPLNMYHCVSNDIYVPLNLRIEESQTYKYQNRATNKQLLTEISNYRGLTQA